jgi:uncharacterized protein
MNTAFPTRSLVVSIHDVSPITQQATQIFLERLNALGVDKCSLLVIPNHHHRGHFLDNKTFCDWLVAQGAAGHEIVIHGYHHQRERKAAENLWQRLMTQTYTQDEGEFYDIDEAQAASLVSKAQAEFAQLGFHPNGFIAPAWLLSEAGEQAVRNAGFAYTTRIGNVLDLASGTQHHSPSMVYSVRNTWRRAASLAWNALLFQRLKNNPLLRIGLHPPDLDHAVIWKQISKYTALALEDRAPMTYWSWLSSQPGFQSKK